jgi:uncharacterized protein (DUF2237 family)
MMDRRVIFFFSRRESIMAKNVLGTDLQPCSFEPLTGWFRDGCCRSGADDEGLHIVCAQMTAEFLQFSKARGNDLSTPHPDWGFPGLQPGDRWCLCVARWNEAYAAGVAPPVVLESTHMSVLEFASLEELRQHAVEA